MRGLGSHVWGVPSGEHLALLKRGPLMLHARVPISGRSDYVREREIKCFVLISCSQFNLSVYLVSHAQLMPCSCIFMSQWFIKQLPFTIKPKSIPFPGSAQPGQASSPSSSKLQPGPRDTKGVPQRCVHESRNEETCLSKVGSVAGNAKDWNISKSPKP